MLCDKTEQRHILGIANILDHELLSCQRLLSPDIEALESSPAPVQEPRVTELCRVEDPAREGVAGIVVDGQKIRALTDSADRLLMLCICPPVQGYRLVRR